jgi:hypothetical protein
MYTEKFLFLYYEKKVYTVMVKYFTNINKMYNHHSGKGMAQNVQPPFRKRNGTKYTTTIQEKEWHKMYNHHSGKGMAQNVQPPFRKRNGMYNHHSGKGMACTTTIQEKEWHKMYNHHSGKGMAF